MSESVSTAPREMAFCNYTILSDDVLIVPDTLEDSRFSQSPMVTGSPYLRFYVGAPILLHEDNKNYRLGTLCLMDIKPNHNFDAQ
ncbi:GAF domain-containing protein, partial [Pseudoalteromonas sp. SIMBA_148]